MELATRAFSAFEVRAVGEGRRTFSGMATTPALDRYNDTINPLGVKFKNPLALLHQHRHDQPIGTAKFGKPTKEGVPFDAEIVQVDEPGALKDRVDTAWGEITHGLVRAVSIGFRPLKYAYKEDGGVEYQEIEVFELSAVTIPALPEAVITQVSKSMRAGEPLSADLVRTIKRMDQGGSVPLVKSSGLPVGAVRLLASS